MCKLAREETKIVIASGTVNTPLSPGICLILYWFKF